MLAVQGRPQAVFGAFAAFRQRRCQPYQPDLAAEAVPPPRGISHSGSSSSSSKDATAVGSPGGGEAAAAAAAAALADRLVAAAEVLHILRPVVYALALRRWSLLRAGAHQQQQQLREDAVPLLCRNVEQSYAPPTITPWHHSFPNQ